LQQTSLKRFALLKTPNMKLIAHSVEQQIDQMEQHSLIAYMKLLGHPPLFSNRECTIFNLPGTDGIDDAPLMIFKASNTFQVNISIYAGNVFDLLNLLFPQKPNEILTYPGRYQLEKLVAADIVNKDCQP
jgi:hypothetical protein